MAKLCGAVLLALVGGASARGGARPARPDRPTQPSDGAGLPAGARCSTTRTRGPAPQACASGLVCQITDPGRPEVDMPNSGTCIELMMIDDPIVIVDPMPPMPFIQRTFYFGTELPATAPRDAILDDGTGFKAGRDQGLSYGWNCDGDPNVDYSSGRRGLGRNDGLGINHFDRNGECAGPVNWEVGVPNGDYDVVVDFGEVRRTHFLDLRADLT